MGAVFKLYAVDAFVFDFFLHLSKTCERTLSYSISNSSKYEKSTAMFCCTSFLASTHARPSIAIKDTIVFDQYYQILSYLLLQLKVERE